MAHTPGPWRAVATEIVSTACPDDDCVVADVLSKDYGDNARLIAAAPELLAALRLAMEWSEDDGYPDDHCMVGPCERAFRQAARAAIAKAEGRTDEE